MSDINVTMLLADHVQAADGKLNMIGAGWTLTPPADYAIPFGIGFIVSVPWDQANRKHTLTVSLEHEDGEPVVDDQQEPLILNLDLEVGRPPGTPPGTTLDEVFALMSAPLPLPADTGFVWVCRQKDEVLERRPFRTKPLPE